MQRSITAVMSAQASFQQEFGQANILDGGPDDGEATGLGVEEEHYTLSSEFRVSIIALRRIICPVFKNEGYFMAVHLRVVTGIWRFYGFLGFFLFFAQRFLVSL